MKKYIIEEELLIQLLSNFFMLDALYEGGIEEWENYKKSCFDYVEKYNAKDFDEMGFQMIKEYGFKEVDNYV